MSSPRVVYVIAGAAPPVLRLADLFPILRERAWDPYPVLTPVAATWVDEAWIERAAGCPVRVEPRLPGEEDPLPLTDAVLVAPLTFNTLNKWAAGISDTLALGLLNELLATGVPIVAAPCIKHTLRKHPAYSASCRTLATHGVTILDPERTIARAPDGAAMFDWHMLVERLDAATLQCSEPPQP